MRCALYAGVLAMLFLACQPGPEPNTPNNKEQHRPNFHFTPPAKWMNDPNGMVYFDGEYHLFYQHFPDTTVWGPMHWGHAVSEDLIHWEHLPIALYPDSLGYIFSGSAVVDHQNTSGFGKDGQPPLVAIFTYHDPVGEKAGTIDFQYQGIAYSNDKGRTWTKYENNPVIPNPGIRDFRDTKVIWDEARGQWVLVLAAWDHIKIYSSSNLKDWEHQSDFGKEWGSHAGVWECPDLFPMQVAGTDEQKWVLLLSINPGSSNGGSGTQYFVGDFDGKTFTLDEDFAEVFGIEPSVVPNGVVYAHFEKGYEGWTTEGTAFGQGPVSGSIDGQNEITGFTGSYLTTSFHGGDQATGKLISPAFRIQKNFINFQIGGGNDKLKTAINLIVDGQIVRAAAGSNGEALRWAGWDVSDLQGKGAHFEIVDMHTGGWGHINVDQIMFSDGLATPEREKAIWLDWGRDNYAGVTWDNAPDNRRIFMGWMSNWDYAQVVPTDSWRSAMTLPRDLVLQNTEQGLRLSTIPSEEILPNLKEEQTIEPGMINDFKELPFHASGARVFFRVKKPDTGSVGITLANSKGESYTLGYHVASNRFYSDRRNAGKKDFSPVFAASVHWAERASDEEVLQFDLFLDVASAEFFADGGSTVMTDIFFPNEDFNKAMIFAEEAEVELLEGTVFKVETH